jgi:hypothetical protein
MCHGEEGEKYEPLADQTYSLNPDKIMAFTGTALRFLESGGELVPKEESERRAKICRSCPYNRPSVCICTPLIKAMEALVPPSRRENGLAICGICGCSLVVKSLLPLTTIRGDQNRHRFPDYCWMKNGQEKS